MTTEPEAGERSSLGTVAARGATVTVAGQAAKFGIQFGGIVVLARLLEPSDFGLVAMVIAVVGVCEVLRDFGLSSAAVQARTLTERQRSNLFWINTGIGAGLTLIVLLCAPLIAGLFDEPRLTSITQVLSVTFLLSGLATQFRAHLTRQMKFGRLAVADIVAQSGGLLAGIALAVGGAGYWAIVGQQVVQALLMPAVTAAWGRWMPGLPHRHEPMRDLLSFGWHLMGTQLLQYASKNVDSVIVGHQFGATNLGYYNRSSQLVNGPLNQLNVPASTVALPVLSRLQDDPPRYRRFLLHGQTALMTLVVGGFLCAAALAGPAVEILLGPSWTPATDLFRLFAIGAAFQGAGYATYWVFTSKGITAAMLRYAIVVRTLSISLLVAGAWWGMIGVAWAYVVGVALSWLLGLLWISRASDAPVREMFANGLRTLLVYGVASTAAYTASRLVDGPIAEVVTGIGALIATCAVIAAGYPRYRGDLVSVRGMARLVKERAS
ncbi:lipopolysaccharide biosynthesis protein [Rhodococcus gannanensis]|uniref:Lipopolysaccharide biosynthesis protein n=1 Tax=Rhodococcus gannanensis TaxID=1960308 RepID=A0ABW4NYG5_9NOCA